MLMRVLWIKVYFIPDIYLNTVAVPSDYPSHHSIIYYSVFFSKALACTTFKFLINYSRSVDQLQELKLFSKHNFATLFSLFTRAIKKLDVPAGSGGNLIVVITLFSSLKVFEVNR